MDIISEVNSFLNASDSIVIKVKLELKRVDYIFYKGEVISSDVSIPDMILKCASIYNVDISPLFQNDLIRWLKDDEVHQLAVNATTQDGSKNVLVCVKRKIDDNNYLVLIENLESKRKLINLVDPLTNVYQKDAFNNYINDVISKKAEPFTLCILDVDNFKNINDNYGHLVGDEILISVAQVIKSNLSTGIVARFGGDEFEFCLPNISDYQEVWNVLYKICHDLKNITTNLKEQIDVTATIGCARYGIDSTSFDELFDCADRALYRGKRKGKNCFIIYDPVKHINIVTSKMYSQIEELNSSSRVVNTILKVQNVLESNNDDTENIQHVANIMAQALSADRVVIYFYDGDIEKPVAKSYRDKEIEDNDHVENYSSVLWSDHYKQRLCSINRTVNLKEVNLTLYKKLQGNGIESVLRCKLEYKDIKLGIIEAVYFKQHDWTIIEKDIISVVSRFFSMNLYKNNEEDYLKYFSSFDELTGLVNYSKFKEISFNRLNSTTKKMVIYYFNIQRFKFINDTFGFSTGDYVLKRFGQLLRKTYSNGVSTRFTSDRFIVIDYYDSNEAVYYHFDKLLKEVHELSYRNTNIGKYLVVVAGVYVTDGNENNVSVAVDKANIARRIMGDVNLDTLQFFTKEISESFVHKNEILMNFSDALKNNEFKLYIQPKIEISTNKLIGCEVLSRWEYKGRLLQPLEYIPILEEAGLLVELDLNVFESLMKLISNLKSKEIKFDIPVSVNVSRNQKNFIAYVEKLDKIREKYQIRAENIELEITESTFTKNVVDIKKLIYYVHRLGYKVSMDDFGSGYSNLSSLVDCGFDCIKIDKSLCAANKSDKKNIVLESVIDLANRLGIGVICEGVETPMQASNLLRLGCFKAQGYLYDKPLAVADFINKYLVGE